MDSINPRVKKAQYAVRGELYLKAMQIESDLKYKVKRAVVLGILQVVHKMASDEGQLFISGVARRDTINQYMGLLTQR